MAWGAGYTTRHLNLDDDAHEVVGKAGNNLERC